MKSRTSWDQRNDLKCKYRQIASVYDDKQKKHPLTDVNETCTKCNYALRLLFEIKNSLVSLEKTGETSSTYINKNFHFPIFLKTIIYFIRPLCAF